MEIINKLIISVAVMVVVIFVVNNSYVGFGAGCVAMYMLMR